MKKHDVKDTLKDVYVFEVDDKVTKIHLNHTLVQCTYCGGIFPMSKVGLRKMGDGSVRSQPRCMPCRSK